MRTIVELYELRLGLDNELKTKSAELEKLKGLLEGATDVALIKEYGATYETIEKEHAMKLKEYQELVNEIKTIQQSVKQIVTELPKHNPGNNHDVSNRNKVKEYLDSKEGLNDYLDILLKNRAMDNSKTRTIGNSAQGTSDHIRESINKEWSQKIIDSTGIEMKAITGAELLAPTPIVRAITDAFEQAGTIFSKVSKFNTLDGWEQLFNIDMSATAGAQIYTAAMDGTQKIEQTQILVSKTINPEIIYKYLPVPNRYSRYGSDKTVLMQYLLSELPRRILYFIEEAIVLGNAGFSIATGGASQSVTLPNTTTPITVPGQTNIIGFEGIANANAAFTWTMASTGDLYTDVANAQSWIAYPGPKTLICSSAQLAALRTTKDSLGQLVYPFNADLLQLFDVNEIITPSWFPIPQKSGDLEAIVAVLPAYRVIGDLNIDTYTNFLLATNTEQYLAECYCGGAPMELQSNVAITYAGPTSP